MCVPFLSEDGIVSVLWKHFPIPSSALAQEHCDHAKPLLLLQDCSLSFGKLSAEQMELCLIQVHCKGETRGECQVQN